MGLLAALHRWWGVAFCLLFAMWFASGIVMHFVPFPARSEIGRVGGSDAGGDVEFIRSKALSASPPPTRARVGSTRRARPWR